MKKIYCQNKENYLVWLLVFCIGVLPLYIVYPFFINVFSKKLFAVAFLIIIFFQLSKAFFVKFVFPLVLKNNSIALTIIGMYILGGAFFYALASFIMLTFSF